MFRENKYMKEK